MEQAPRSSQQNNPAEIQPPLTDTVELPELRPPLATPPPEETTSEKNQQKPAHQRRVPTVERGQETTSTVGTQLAMSSNTTLSTRRSIRGNGVVTKHKRKTPPKFPNVPVVNKIGRTLTETKSYIGAVPYEDVDAQARLMEGDIELGYERALRLHEIAKAGLKPAEERSEEEKNLSLKKALKSLSIAGLTWTDPKTNGQYRVMYEDYGLDEKGHWNQQWQVATPDKEKPVDTMSNAKIIEQLGALLDRDTSEITEHASEARPFIQSPVTQADVDKAGEARQQQQQQRQEAENAKIAIAAAQLEATQRLVQLEEARQKALQDARESVAEAHEETSENTQPANSSEMPTFMDFSGIFDQLLRTGASAQEQRVSTSADKPTTISKMTAAEQAPRMSDAEYQRRYISVLDLLSQPEAQRLRGQELTPNHLLAAFAGDTERAQEAYDDLAGASLIDVAEGTLAANSDALRSEQEAELRDMLRFGYTTPNGTELKLVSAQSNDNSETTYKIQSVAANGKRGGYTVSRQQLVDYLNKN